MFARLEQVVATASSLQRDRASGQVSLFGDMGFSAPAPSSKNSAGAPSVAEWSKDERLAHEKELLGFYVTGHPLDKFRGVIDSDRFKRLGLIEDLDLSNPRDRFSFAGMIRSLEAKVTKTGKPFGVLVLEDFTGSSEVVLWGESFVPARDEGLLEVGKIVKMRCAVQSDERTGGFRLTGSDVSELKPKRASANGKGVLDLVLWTSRHGDWDIEEISRILGAHPGSTPVRFHIQNSAGKRATVEAGEAYRVKLDRELESALERWIDAD